MNDIRKKRLSQLDKKSFIVGIDISKGFHVARAFDYRGIEIGKMLKFNNDIFGYKLFELWCSDLMISDNKFKIIIGMEPTGIYWINLARYLVKQGIEVVTVNPMHVKKTKELDDNSQTKTDKKDAKLIANLVKDARYSTPNLLEGIYEELRNAKKFRKILKKDIIRKRNQIINWLDRFFPETGKAYKLWDSKSLIRILKEYTFPNIIAEKTTEELYMFLPPKSRHGVGKNKLRKLIEAAKESIGSTVGLTAAKMEIVSLLKDFEGKNIEIEELDNTIIEMCKSLKETKLISEIKGIGIATASTIVAELGDIRKYKSPSQIIKMAGLALIEQSSGKHKGETTISKRGRAELRTTLYMAIVSMLKHNDGFKQLYSYYTKRPKNQLKGKQAIIALIRKLLRIIHALIVKNVSYDENKMLLDIIHPKEFRLVS
jgi:transposase